MSYHSIHSGSTIDSAVTRAKDDNTFLLRTEKGASIATLVSGKVPTEQLPSFISEVTNGYYSNGIFYEDEALTQEINPDDITIYVDLIAGDSYRWSGEKYIIIASDSVNQAIRWDKAQNLTDVHKSQARNNMDAVGERELLDLKMLGWTVPKDSPIQNFKDDNGVYHQRVGRVDLGSLTWNYESAYQTFYSNDFPTPLYNNQTLGYCYKYSVTPIAFDVMPDKFISTWWQNFSTYFRVLLKDLSFSSPASLKESLQGVYLYYELPTEITRPIDGGEWGVRYSNPNLLDNGWFGNGVVNQRGQTSYTTDGFTIDRWKKSDGIASVNIRDGFINLAKATSGSPDFFQTLDKNTVSNIVGKIVTVSVLMNGGNLFTATGLVDPTEQWQFVRVATEFGEARLQYKYASATDHTVTAIFDIYCSNSSPNIVAAKLELGSVSTLANDSAPDYATELLKCQRYFFRVSAITTFAQLAGSAGGAGVFIPIPIKMRATPTFSYINKGTMIVGGNLYTPTSVSLSSALENTITLSLTGDWILTRQPAIWANDSALNFSADL